jgi:hypothetical protein
MEEKLSGRSIGIAVFGVSGSTTINNAEFLAVNAHEIVGAESWLPSTPPPA